VIQVSFAIETWINDGLMAIFFFVNWIRDQNNFGESTRKGDYACYWSIGGMIIPALLYLFINYQKMELMAGEVPMATDMPSYWD
jgi:NhaA family Na+:H+ antiporter